MSDAKKRGRPPLDGPVTRVPSALPTGLVELVRDTAASRGISVKAAWTCAARWWVLSHAPAPVPPLADEDQ